VSRIWSEHRVREALELLVHISEDVPRRPTVFRSHSALQSCDRMVGRRRIKVAYVINDLLLGGAQKAVFDMSRMLNKNAFDSSVYILSDYDKRQQTLTREFSRSGVQVIKLNPGAKGGLVPSFFHLLRKWGESRPDVVHLHLPDSVISGGFAALVLHIPYIIHEHQTPRFHSWKLRYALRLFRIFSALTICYSTSIEREIFGDEKLLDSPPELLNRRSYSVRNAVPTSDIAAARHSIERESAREELGIDADAIVLISVARLVRWKGQKNLLEAFAKVAPDFPRSMLCFVGDGPDMHHLVVRVRELAMSDRVIFLGARSDIYKILAISDVFSLVFSYPEHVDAEAVGIAGWEAMAAKLPLLAGKYKNIDPGLKDGENVVLVNPHDVQNLEMHLRQLIASPTERERIGQNAARFVSVHFDLSGIIPVYERIYERIARI
jgi:L-malate glycosyltransferase